ncbi:MAG: magnesium transporter [Pseudomonadota bacterium]
MADIFEEFVEEINHLIEHGDIEQVKNKVSEAKPADIAFLLRRFKLEERKVIFDHIKDEEKKAEVLSELEDNEIEDLLEDKEPTQIASILATHDSDDVADVINALSDEKQKEVLREMDSEESEELTELLRYDEDSAGGIMNPIVFKMIEDLTVKEAIEKVNEAKEYETVFYIYIIDDHDRLTGVVSLRELILAKSSDRLGDIMSEEIVHVDVDEDQEEVARLVSRYNYLAVPVVDYDHKLVGIITVDDVIDVLRDEATEDILKMAGSTHEELSSKDSFKSAKSRLPWLFVCWIQGILAIKLIGAFEETLQTYVALAAFIPIINGMSGNVGAQSVALMVRGLSTKKIAIDQAWGIIFKEFRVGIIMGIAYAGLLSVLAIFQYPEIVNLGYVVGISLFASMVLGTLIGAIIPIFLESIKIDPAIASGPFVTTSIDLLAVLLFFSCANLLLPL